VSADAAVAELLRLAGTQFDAEVIAAFQAELAVPSRERSPIPHAAGFDGRVLSVTGT
jgi:hypothetical protein